VELATSRASRARLKAAAYSYLERHHALATAQASVRELVGLGNSSPRVAAELAQGPVAAPA
jgi:hypothetical protein